MSNQALTWAWAAPIPTGPKMVLVALADHASDHAGEDWTCFPSAERLMAFTSMPQRTLERHIKWLEAEGWLTRVTPRDRRGRKQVRRYTLHRDRLARAVAEAAEAAAAEGAGTSPEPGCPPANMAGGGDGAHPPKTPLTTRQKGASPPAILAGGHYKDEPPEEPSGTPTPCARAREAGRDEGFEAAVAAWAARAPERVSPARARAAWDVALVRSGLTSEALLAAVLAAVERDPDFPRGKAMNLDRWLAEDRFEPWLIAGAGARRGRCAPAIPALPVGPWEGPAEVRAAVLAAIGPEGVASYLDPAGWSGEGRVIEARTSVAAERLRRQAGAALAQLGVTVEFRPREAMA